MLEKIISNPTLFYTIFVLVFVFLILFLILIIRIIKKKYERSKLKKTSDKILDFHYEEPKEESLEDEIKKIEEKANENEITTESNNQNEFIIGKPIQIEINSEKEEKKSKIDKNTSDQMDYIERVLSKMQQDLTKQKEQQIYEFEKEQEENAIISYKELMKSYEKDSTYIEDTANNLINIDLFNDLEIISIDDIVLEKDIDKKEENNKTTMKKEIKEFNENLTSKVKQSPVNVEIEYNDKPFKKSDFISPVYGRMESKLEYPTVQNINKITSKPISEMGDEEFLNTLKAFRKNL